MKFIYSEPGTLLGGTAIIKPSGTTVNLTSTNFNKIYKITPLVETTISVELEVFT